MRKVRTRSITTHSMAILIANEFDVPLIEVLEILKKEHALTYQLVKTNEQVIYDELIIFKPVISRYGNKSCKVRLSQNFSDGLRDIDRKRLRQGGKNNGCS